jgi:hypothetical protein
LALEGNTKPLKKRKKGSLKFDELGVFSGVLEASTEIF